MELLTEIRKNFAAQLEASFIELKSEKDTWTIRQNDYFGVAVRNVNNVEINEKFNNVRIFNRKYLSESSEEVSLIVLASDLFYLRNEFAVVAAQFVELGENKENRTLIQTNPLMWWEKWRKLLGNAVTNKTVYDVVGEMMAYKYLLENNTLATWGGPDYSTHDLETKKMSIDVKSTIKKYADEITINSQYQAREMKDLYLFLCKLEESERGKSIDDLVSDLVKLGVNSHKIEEKLGSLGYEKGTRNRQLKYVKLEGKRFHVNDKFPKINKDSFKNNQIPANITKIEYTINLAGLEYEVW